MALDPGTRLGPYEVLAPLGAGGMGEVYKARDTRLDRTVALKILPAEFSEDAARRGRFAREAKTISQLNHPHICVLHDVGEAVAQAFRPAAATQPASATVSYLVMEHLEGQTLAQRLAKGRLPLDEALRIGAEIADALAAAHRHGVIHRDLKPSNIMLARSGSSGPPIVKLLDFGLAKVREHGERLLIGSGGPSGPPSAGPTETESLTNERTLVGTLPYMAPEQVEGKPADARTDIWALGCVPYEMVTGARAFDGDSQASLITAIMSHQPPPLSGAEPLTPPALDHVVRTCLAKEPDARWQAASDVSRELEWVAGSRGAETGAASGPARPARWHAPVAWSALGAAVVLLVVATVLILAGDWPWRSGGSLAPMRVSVVHTDGTEVGGPAISPDGRRIAYRARAADGVPMIWVRDLETSVARPLPGTEDGRFPFWSPDSRDLAFIARGLKRVPADGGPVEELVPPPVRFGGAWAPDGTILFAPEGGLFRVDAAGGEPEPATNPPGADWGHYWPSFLPDGRRFLFTAKLWTRSADSSEQGVFLGSLDSPDARRLLPDLTSAVYAPPGYLVFARQGTLMAAPFDVGSGTVTGLALSLDEAVAVDATYYLAGVSTALDGTLAVRPPPAPDLGYESNFESELKVLNRDGSVNRVLKDRREYAVLALAPDGTRAAVSITDSHAGSRDLWLVDLQTGTHTPITTTRAYAAAGVWSPDGTRLAYALQPPGLLDDVHLRDFRTGQDEQLIDTPNRWEHPVAWSADGDYLLVTVRVLGGVNDLYVWSFKTRSLAPFVESPWSEGSAVFSPDGRYVAYNSAETGRGEVYVTTFPEAGARWPLTTGGARPMSWSRDGHELLVATSAGQMVGYPVTTDDGSFSAGSPVVLVRGLGSVAYSASASHDHSRILVRVNPDAERDKGEIRLLFGWADGLSR